MRLRIASDLHLDAQADHGRDLIRRLSTGPFDVLVVAGDLSNYAALAPSLTNLCDKVTQPIVFVMGNHEPYGKDIMSAKADLAEAAQAYKHFHWLDRGSVTVGGYRFVGATLWFPYPWPRADGLERFMGDFGYIRGFADQVGALAEGDAAYLERNVGEGDIVVTHHLPHPRSIAPRFAMSALNPFFLHDQSALIRRARPRLWIHGHTHDPMDYTVGATRIFANPHGYPNEAANFTVKHIVLPEVP